jgi:transposase InsO family protein
MAGEGLPVQLATRVLDVTDSGHYAWRSRAPSARAIRHVWLTDQILAVHTASHGTYGARRVHAELTLGRGLVVGHGTGELLMARAGIRGVTGRPRWRRPTPDLVSADLVERNFTRSAPNQLWVTDITEHPTREGKVYCAVVLDTYSRRVVGWSIDASPTAALVTSALGMAIDARTPPSGAVIHSDRLSPVSSAPGRSPTGRKPPVCCPRWAASPTASTVSISGSLRWRSDPCYDRPCGCLRVDVSTVAAATPGPLAGRS